MYNLFLKLDSGQKILYTGQQLTIIDYTTYKDRQNLLSISEVETWAYTLKNHAKVEISLLEEPNNYDLSACYMLSSTNIYIDRQTERRPNKNESLCAYLQDQLPYISYQPLQFH